MSLCSAKTQCKQVSDIVFYGLCHGCLDRIQYALVFNWQNGYRKRARKMRRKFFLPFKQSKVSQLTGQRHIKPVGIKNGGQRQDSCWPMHLLLARTTCQCLVPCAWSSCGLRLSGLWLAKAAAAASGRHKRWRWCWWWEWGVEIGNEEWGIGD